MFVSLVGSLGEATIFFASDCFNTDTTMLLALAGIFKKCLSVLTDATFIVFIHLMGCPTTDTI
jgi:hypothetical protein